MTLSYKKPVFWIIILAIIVAIFAAVCVLTDPKDKTEDQTPLQTETAHEDDPAFTQKVHWDDLQEFTFTSGENGFLFDMKKEIFVPYQLDYESENWKEPILLAKSFDDLFYILEHCTENKKLSEETKAAVKAYFNQKNQEFLDIYPSATPYDFFQDHTILIFYTPITTGGVINDIHLKANGDVLDISLQIGSYFVNSYEEYQEISNKNYGELQFLWIAKNSFAKFRENPITCNTKKSFQTDWIQNKSYIWENKKKNFSAGVSFSYNRYQNKDASLTIWIEDYKEEKEYRYRIQNFGDISDNRYVIQRAEVPKVLPDEPVKLEYEDAYVFIKNDYILTYDAEASPIKLKGVPDKAEFYWIDYLNSLLD